MLEKIERMKAELDSMVLKYDCLDKRVLKKSQELDKLINKHIKSTSSWNSKVLMNV